MGYEPEQLIGCACVAFPFVLLGLMAIAARWINRHSPPEPEPDFWIDETQPPQRNFEVVMPNSTEAEPLDAITIDEPAPPDSPEHNPLGRNNHDPR